MRNWPIKQGAAILGCHEKKFPQAWDPSVRKVARLMLADPARTTADICEAMQRIVREREADGLERPVAVGAA